MNFKAEAKIPIAAVAMVLFYINEFWMMIMIGVRWIFAELMILIQFVFWFSECSDAHPCVGLSNHAHFRNFGMAFLTLFRVATGDNWNGIMKVSWRWEWYYESV